MDQDIEALDPGDDPEWGWRVLGPDGKVAASGEGAVLEATAEAGEEQ